MPEEILCHKPQELGLLGMSKNEDIGGARRGRGLAGSLNKRQIGA